LRFAPVFRISSIAMMQYRGERRRCGGAGHAWLDEEAAKPEWRAIHEATRQGELF
jgi:hypothetical protein